MEKLLDGVCVLELGNDISVRYAGKMLADMGARVAMVDLEEILRDGLPDHSQHLVPEAREIWKTAYFNIGKEQCEPSELNALLSKARIVLIGEDHTEEATLDFAKSIHRDYPDAVVLHIAPTGMSPNGRKRPVTELTLQALGAICLGIGLPGRSPLRLPGDQTAYQGGVCAAIAAVAGLGSPQGCLVDLASVDIWATLYNGGEVANDFFGRKKLPRAGYRVSRQPYLRAIFECQNGFFAIQCTETRHWQAFLIMIGREDLMKHPMFGNRWKANDEHVEERDAWFVDWFKERTKNEILKDCIRYKIPGAPVYDVAEVSQHEHLASRNFFARIQIDGTSVQVPTYPFKLSSSKNSDGKSRPRPLRGQSDPRQPLKGITVADFGWVWAGAIPGHILADLGATVIRVEGRKPLDFMRQGRPIVGVEKDPEQNPVFQNVNRGKLGICFDLANPEAAELVKKLVSRSDVVIENFSPGVMERFGLGWGDLSKVRSDLIMCSMSAAGQMGPLSNIRTYAAMIASLSGMNSMVGYPGERVLGIQAPPYADPNAGLHAAFAIVAALMGREKHGGTYIDLSQWESSVTLMARDIIRWGTTGEIAGTEGVQNGMSSPCGHYPVKGSDKWIALDIRDQAQWGKLQDVLGRPSWMKAPDFSTLERRVEAKEKLNRALANETSFRDGETLALALRAQGVPAEVLLDVGEVLGHPYFKERGLFEMVRHPTLKEVPVYRLPWRINGTPIPVSRRAPQLGEHTAQILSSVLGKTEEEIRDLRSRKIIV